MVDLGLIQLEHYDTGSSFALQPMMRDAIYIDDDTRPSVSSCRRLLDSIRSLCSVLGRCEENPRILSMTIYSIIENIDINVGNYFNQFLLDVWSYLNVHEDKNIMQCFTSDMERIILESKDYTADQMALLTFCKCEFIEDAQTKIKMFLNEISLLETVTEKNAGLMTTLYSNLAVYYTTIKEYEKAEQAFQQAYDIFSEYGLTDTDGFGELLFNRIVFLFSTNREEAMDCLKKYAARCPEIGTIHSAEAHALYARFYRECGNLHEGKIHLITAIQSYYIFYRDKPEKALSQFNLILADERKNMLPCWVQGQMIFHLLK